MSGTGPWAALLSARSQRQAQRPDGGRRCAAGRPRAGWRVLGYADPLTPNPWVMLACGESFKLDRRGAAPSEALTRGVSWLPSPGPTVVTADSVGVCL